MVFFEKTGARTVTRESLVPDRSPSKVLEYLSQMMVDANGNFSSGISKLHNTIDLDNILSYIPKLDTKLGLFEAIVKFVHTNVCKDCSEFTAFCQWVFPRTKSLEKEWVQDYEKQVKQFIKNCFVMSRKDLDEDSKLLPFLREMRKYWIAVREYEFCKCLWSGEFIAIVYCQSVHRSEVGHVDEVYVHTALDLKKSIEFSCVGDVHYSWWKKAQSCFRLQCIGNQQWLHLCEYFKAVGNLLHSMTVTESDFCENPLHYMLGDVCNWESVITCAGSVVVCYLTILAEEFEQCRYYAIASTMDTILSEKEDILQIEDNEVRNYAIKAVNLLMQNCNFIKNYCSYWDEYVGNYICVNGIGAMPKSPSIG